MAQEINARVQISPELQNLIDHNSEIAPKAIKSGMKLITRRAPKKVRKKVRSLGLIKTGRLVKSIRGKTGKDKSVIGSQHFVGHILEGGAKSHVIKAKKGKYLRIPIGGRSLFVRQVRHPGHKAYKFLEDSIGEMQSSGEIQSLFSQGVNQAIEELASQ
jgi:phage gpG-like protein